MVKKFLHLLKLKYLISYNFNFIACRLSFLLESYKGTEKIMGVILSAAYIVAKGNDLLQRIKFLKRSFLKFLQKTVSHLNIIFLPMQYKCFIVFLELWNCTDERAGASEWRYLRHLSRQLQRSSHFERVFTHFL